MAKVHSNLSFCFLTWISWLSHIHSPFSPPADIGCTCPPCTSTAYGWDTSPRSSSCCRSLRKSSSAWRPCFSSASVGFHSCLANVQSGKTRLFMIFISFQSHRRSFFHLCLWSNQHISVFPPVPVEGLKSQKYFDELRLTYINELDRLIQYRMAANCSQRFYQLTRLLDSLQVVRRSAWCNFSAQLFLACWKFLCRGIKKLSVRYKPKWASIWSN